MKIYDISQEVFECEVYPGDPRPEKQILCSLDNGDLYTLSSFSMCAHNGTHIDAPSHFIKDADSVTDIPLEKLVGPAYVAKCEGEISTEDAIKILKKAQNANQKCTKRILIGGKATVTNEAAAAFASAGILLIGNESQTVGEEEAPMAAHIELLSKGVVILEGIRLDSVPEGVYLLFAAPLALGGCEGSPCRAVLVELD